MGGRTITSEDDLREVIGAPARGRRQQARRPPEPPDAPVRRALAVRLHRDRPAGRRGSTSRRAATRPASCASSTNGRCCSPTGPGNRLADTLTNLLVDPRVGLLFLIPGVGDTFRVNGRGLHHRRRGAARRERRRGKAPKLGILVEIEEAYTQCSKALIRSDLWNPERHIDRSELPEPARSSARSNDPDFDAEQYDRERAERYARREGLY